MTDTPSPVETPAADPAWERAERHMRALAELGEIGMALARDLRDRALDRTAPDANLAGVGDVGLAFSRIARAVRLTLALEAKIGEG